MYRIQTTGNTRIATIAFQGSRRVATLTKVSTSRKAGPTTWSTSFDHGTVVPWGSGTPRRSRLYTSPVTTMYVLTQATATDSQYGSGMCAFTNARMPATASTTTDDTFGRTVKKLKKFTAVVATSRPSDIAPPIVRLAWAMMAAAIRAATAIRRALQTAGHLEGADMATPVTGTATVGERLAPF